MKYLINLFLVLAVGVSLFCHDVYSQTVVNTIFLGESATGVAVNPNTNLIYASFGSSQYKVIDGLSNTVINTIAPSGNTILDMDVNTNTNNIVVLIAGCIGENCVSDATILLVDGPTNDVIDSGGLSFLPNDFAINTSTNQTYVTNPNNTVSVFNESGNELASNISVGNVPTIISFDSARQLMYVFNSQDNNVSIIDTSTNGVTATIATGTLATLLELGFNNETNLVYMAFSDNTVKVLDGSTNEFIVEIVIDGSVAALAVNSSTNHIFVVSSSNDKVFVIDGATNQIVKTLDVGRVPLEIAINPITNTVFVANNIGQSITVIQDDAGVIDDEPDDGSFFALPKLSIFGVVSGTEFNLPLAGAVVVLIGNVKPFSLIITTITGASGIYSFFDVTPGNHIMLACNLPGFGCVLETVNYTGGSLTFNIDLPLLPQPEPDDDPVDRR